MQLLDNIRGIDNIEENEKYLVKINSNGEIEAITSKIEVLGISSVGVNKPKKVKINTGKKGYCKNSTDTDDSDDLEIIINYIGRIFGATMAEEYRVISHDYYKESLLSIDVSQDEDTVFTEFEHYLKEAVSKVQNGEIGYESWMDEWIRINTQLAFPNTDNNFEFCCKEEKDYSIAVEMPMHILKALYPADDKSYRQFKEAYIKMIVFDLFIGQVDRNMNNYGVLFNNKTEQFSLAPLFDNATLEKPYLPENLYVINRVVMDRNELLIILMKNHKDDFENYFKKIAEIYNLNRTQITEMANMWLNEHQKKLLLNNMERMYQIITQR